ncbi:MAG: LysM peptidoglycan-binding domain-containing protein [Pseudomonadales bacterium]|nr:LysM peptidoglycan-binding domain-containing protein [Pseudomonadales bacterium]
MKTRFRQFVLSLSLVLIGGLCSTAALAQGGLLKLDRPESYTVSESDTLWNIASQFLQDPERWPEVWQPDPYLDNSDFIYPGDTLKLSYVDGSPRILVQRGDRTVEELGPVMREEALSSSIPAIPLESIENSFTRNRIVSEELLESAAYIVDNVADNLAIATGDEVYARGNWPTGTTSFEVYRPLREHLDDEDDDIVLGVELEYMGFASITDIESPDVRRLLINNSYKEIRVGDRLLVREESTIGATIFPTEPVENLDGSIVAFLGNETMASQLDTIVIDLGLSDNLAVGDVLAISKVGSEMVDEIERERMSFRERMRAIFRGDRLALPGNETGTVLVYRTFEDMSYAVILNSLEPIELTDRVVNP